MTGSPIRPPVAREDLLAALDERGARRLTELEAEVAADPSRLGRVFPAVGREVGRGTLATSHGPLAVPDAARVHLLAAAATATGSALLAEVRELYRYGDSDEKRAVLMALAGWDDDEVDAHDLLEDALRTNDTRLVAAAMGPHARTLDAAAWRHGVLKCLFTGVPVTAVAGLAARADAELAAMARRYAAEREAAGREVPPDVAVVLAACPDPGPDPRQET